MTRFHASTRALIFRMQTRVSAPFYVESERNWWSTREITSSFRFRVLVDELNRDDSVFVELFALCNVALPAMIAVDDEMAECVWGCFDSQTVKLVAKYEFIGFVKASLKLYWNTIGLYCSINKLASKY